MVKLDTSLSVSLLSDSEWQSTFPREKYPKDPEARAHSLKFLIAFKQPDANILSLIERLKQKKSSSQLNSSFTTHKLTALHMAVMKNRPEVAGALLEAGANPNARKEWEEDLPTYDVYTDDDFVFGWEWKMTADQLAQYLNDNPEVVQDIMFPSTPQSPQEVPQSTPSSGK